MDTITLGKAYAIVMDSVRYTGIETVALSESLGRILAGDAVSDMDMPPFNKAAVDGFACRREDLGSELKITETIAAGRFPDKAVIAGTCARIMTGAAVPEGADMVFMVEDSLLKDSDTVIFSGNTSKNNISIRGEDLRKGEIVLHAGQLIRPQEIAVLASVGYAPLVVNRKPVLGVISSGDELVEPDEKPGASQIRNSNAGQLLAQAERAGAKPAYFGIARDDGQQTLEILKLAVDKCDIVVISGGVSMGDFDFIPAVMEQMGIKILFDRIKVQPGKPTTFGVHEKALVFGLPGNPVSSFIQFELLVRPLICKMMGHNYIPATSTMQFAESYSRRTSDRLGLIPVEVTKEGLARVVDYHGSAHISALTRASGIVEFAIGQQTIEKGEWISVRQI